MFFNKDRGPDYISGKEYWNMNRAKPKSEFDKIFDDISFQKPDPEPSVHLSLPKVTPFDRLPLSVRKFLIKECSPLVTQSDIFGNKEKIIFNKWRSHSELGLMTIIKHQMVVLPFTFETYLELNYGNNHHT